MRLAVVSGAPALAEAWLSGACARSRRAGSERMPRRTGGGHEVILLALSLAAGAVADVPAKGGPPPDEASLLLAWETAQRQSPGTEVLERTGDRRYRFKTSRFPFDGELVVLNLLIEPLPVDGEPGYNGTVEVDLVGLPDDVRSRYVQSFARWQAATRSSTTVDAASG